VEGNDPNIALSEAQTLEEVRARKASRPDARNLQVTATSAFACLASAVALCVLGRGAFGPVDLWAFGLLVVLWVVVGHVRYEVVGGDVLLTQPVFVPMLVLLPPPWVPIAIITGELASNLFDVARRRQRLSRVPVALAFSWFALGPALVLTLHGPDPLAWDDTPILLLALVAQFAFDGVSSILREWLGIGVSPRALLRPLATCYVIDALLAPLGLVVGLEGQHGIAATLAVLGLTGLLWLLAVDRRRTIDHTMELAGAYKGASEAARIDPLTGLGNRLAWEEMLEQAERDRLHHGTQVTVVLIDLDNLKLANDTLGHQFGDQLIVATAMAVSTCMRPQDFGARIGGDELAILVQGSDTTAMQLQQDVRAAIEAAPPLGDFLLSASLGSASSPPATAVSDAVALADARMYADKQARKAGRGRMAA
jgi:diguanylate cyclase (GGDEF)-like protein